MMSNEAVRSLFSDAINRRVLKKAIFSKPEEKTVLRETASLIKKADGSVTLAVERFTTDHKTYRRNLSPDDVAELCRMILEEYRQVNLLTTAGDVEVKRSKAGALHLSGKLSSDATKAPIAEEKKNYLLDNTRDIAFLRELGVADANGRIHDKKQAKFRQINRFLEIVRDVEDRLPTDRPAVLYDLCCGKSYLTFAVYYYFTVIKQRNVHMWGVDLKKDVIDTCRAVAERCGFENLHFVSGNINQYEPPEAPDLVISLHACDIATDLVLANAVRWKTKIILSTPCCHHEMAHQLAEPMEDAPLRSTLSFLFEHPMLRQKFCDAATDALRCKRLEAVGYRVSTLELIDPEETPKNLMIRAIYDEKIPPAKKAAALSSYREACAELGVCPSLDQLLGSHED